MAFSFFKIFNGLKLIPKTTATNSDQGDLEVLTTDGNLYYDNGSSSSPVLTSTNNVPISNKDLSGNTATNLVNGAGTFDFNSSGTVTVPNITDTLVGQTATETLSNKTLTSSIISGSNNTLSNIAYSSLILTNDIVDSDINSAAAIERTKIASGTANQVVINDGSGVLSSEATLAKSRGGSAQDNSSITFPASGVLTTNAGVQTLTNKTFGDDPVFTEIATPSAPPSGGLAIYAKVDGNLYKQTSSGVETQFAASSPVVAARASTDTNTIANNSATQVIYSFATYDTNSGYNTSTGNYTVPAGLGGKFIIDAATRFSATSWNTSDIIEFYLYRNGSPYSILNRHTIEIANASLFFIEGSDAISCAAGDVLAIYAFQNHGIPLTLDGNGHFSITRIGS